MSHCTLMVSFAVIGALCCACLTTAVALAERSNRGNYEFIDNGVIRVGVDMDRGGVIGYLAPSDERLGNVINEHDMGREVQLSFYAGPAFYNPEDKCDKLFMGQEWPWNPIGAGDIKGNHGKTKDIKIN